MPTEPSKTGLLSFFTADFTVEFIVYLVLDRAFLMFSSMKVPEEVCSAYSERECTTEYVEECNVVTDRPCKVVSDVVCTPTETVR